MKVCTDACIFGAWAAEKIKTNNPEITSILDIGTGTGLLSLMIAQKIQAQIDAIEIDEDAFMQAGNNFSESLWGRHLRTLHADAKNFTSHTKYSFIISNPPFFEEQLLSPEKKKNIAKHDDGLKLDELIKTIRRNLKSSGRFAILLPYHRINYFENIAKENHFFLEEKLLIRQTLKHNFFRGVLLFTQTKHSTTIKELTIKINDRYSHDFILLLKDYYPGL